MYSPPTELADQHRMCEAFTRAVKALDAMVDGPEVWGWYGRTLSSRVKHPRRGTCWLRLLSAPENKASGKIWDGNRAASDLFDGRVRKPVLHEAVEDTSDGYAYQAELHQYVDDPVCSSAPVLRTDRKTQRSGGHGEVAPGGVY